MLYDDPIRIVEGGFREFFFFFFFPWGELVMVLLNVFDIP